jgi:CheY-like chemotaxis protein
VTNKARILLVDDRGENLVALEAILSSLNQVLVPVRSGEEALKALLVDEFAVILLDVVMPGMDGFETAAHIKRRPKTRDVPIIFLTAASAEPDHAFRGYAAGAVDYISKPFDPWVLRAKVSVFVELYAKNRQLREQAELLRSRLDTGVALDRAAVRQAILAPGTGPDAGDPAEAAAGDGGPAGAAAESGRPATGGARPLLLELSGRLAAVEDLVGVLSAQPSVSGDTVLADCAAQLEHRVGRLRDALDALRVG